MMKSTKLILTGAASLLGVALATGGAYAASGTLTAFDSPGQVLKLSGVGPASAHASATAKAHANANAKGLFGTKPTPTPTPAPTDPTNVPTPTPSASATVTPVAPSVASKDASTVKGSQTGKEISAWAHQQNEVHTVAPGGAVDVSSGVTAGASAGN